MICTKIKYLVVRHLHGTSNKKDERELKRWIAKSKDHKILLQQLKDLKVIIEQFLTITKKDKEAAHFYWICKVDEFYEKYYDDRFRLQ
jgi:hypothetical protein